MIAFTLFSNQPAGQGQSVHIAPWAVVDIIDALCKRSDGWHSWTWAPVAIIVMCHGGIYLVENYDYSVRIRIEAGKREGRKNERATGFVE